MRLVTPDIVEKTVDIRMNDTHVEFSANSLYDNRWTFSFQFFRRIEAQISSWEVGKDFVQFYITKKWHWRYWPRLVREIKGQGEIWEHIGVDWKRFKAEDESEFGINSEADDDDWLDEEYGLIKEARFPLEEWDDSQFPLLDDKTFTDWVDAQEACAVLFFNRKERKNMQQHALYASISKMIQDEIPVARVDAAHSDELVKKLRISAFPHSQLFLKTGETFVYDGTKFTRGRELVNFLYRQVQPAYRELHNSTHAAAFFRNFSRVAVGVFDDKSKKGFLSKETQFDHMARGFRSRIDLVPLVFAKVNASQWDYDDFTYFIKDTFDKEPPYTGLVMEKQGEEDVFFKGKWKHDVLSGWAYNTQFNLLEHITPHNFEEFRNRRVPLVYIMVDDSDAKEHAGLLDEVKELSKEYYGKLSFVYSRVQAAGDLMEHLRCEYNGQTFGVLEDFVMEYRYCATPQPGERLEIERLRSLVEGYMSRNLLPDKVRSEKVPPADYFHGPVRKVVGDTLIDTILQPNKDVIIHLYADFDKEAENMQDELVKFAERVEDVPSVQVARMEGLLNERPSDFPDLGYFPCTWLFPMYNKFEPRSFNASSGFNADRLLLWANRTLSYPLPEEVMPKGERDPMEGAVLGWNGERPDGDIDELIVAERQAILPNGERRPFVIHDEL